MQQYGVRQKEYKRETIFLFMYFVCTFGLFMSLIDSAPAPGLCGKLKFLYILFCFCDFILHRRRILEIHSTVILLALIVYVIYFGKLVTYPTAETEIHNHVILMTYYLLILTGTVIEVNYYNCVERFCQYTFNCIAWFIVYAGITHVGQIVLNPFYFIKMLLFSMRVTSKFGFSTSNYMGNAGYVAFVFSVLQLIMLSDQKKLTRNYLIYTIVMDGVVFLIFQSASSRSPSISLAIFIVTSIFLELIGNNRLDMDVKKKRTIQVGILILIIAFLAIATLFGLWSYIWKNSNRDLNVKMNLPYVGKIGTKWTGMGFVENGAYQDSGRAFGVDTSSLDMNYLFWYCSTGIIGCIYMGSILVYTLIRLFISKKKLCGGIVLAIFLSLLFYGYFETVWFCYRMWTLFPVTVVFLCWMGNSRKKRYLQL